MASRWAGLLLRVLPVSQAGEQFLPGSQALVPRKFLTWFPSCHAAAEPATVGLKNLWLFSKWRYCPSELRALPLSH